MLSSSLRCARQLQGCQCLQYSSNFTNIELKDGRTKVPIPSCKIAHASNCKHFERRATFSLPTAPNSAFRSYSGSPSFIAVFTTSRSTQRSAMLAGRGGGRLGRSEILAAWTPTIFLLRLILSNSLLRFDSGAISTGALTSRIRMAYADIASELKSRLSFPLTDIFPASPHLQHPAPHLLIDFETTQISRAVRQRHLEQPGARHRSATGLCRRLQRFRPCHRRSHRRTSQPHRRVFRPGCAWSDLALRRQ